MATTIAEQIVREAPEIEARKLGLMDSAKLLADKPIKQFDYQVAPLTGDQLSAIELGRQGIGGYQPYLTRATGALDTATGLTGEAVSTLREADTRAQYEAARRAMDLAAQSARGVGRAETTLGGGIAALQGAGERFAPTVGMMQQYMNPYQQAVIDESMRQIQRQGDIARQNLQAQAVRSGAFGGSREGIQRAELDRALAEQQNAAIVGALQSGYGQAQQAAQQAFEQQKQRQLAGASAYSALAGQQADILGRQSQLLQGLSGGIGSLANQQFGIGQQIASGIGQFGAQMGNLGVQQAALGQTAQQLGQSDVNFLYGLGQSQQAQAQAQLDAARASAVQREMEPYQRLGFISDIYRGAPSSQMTTTASARPTPSPFQQAAGLATGTISTLAAAEPLI